MCMPREPLVFGQPRRPVSSSSAFTSRATRCTSDHATPGPGSRSTRSSSGCSRSAERTGCGCSSRQPRLTIQARPAASSTTNSSAVRPEGNDRVTVRSQGGRSAGRALLIEGFGFRAVDEALEDQRAIADAGESAGRNGKIVADEVELGELDLPRKVELIGMGDADFAACDGEDFGCFFRFHTILSGRRFLY